MGEKTGIEWCDRTFNPWVGCTKISPACDHCYAEGWAKRAGEPGLWTGGERRRTSLKNWNLPLRWDRQAAKSGTRLRVFCASLADVFDNQVPAEWRDDLWDLIHKTRNLDWLLLTKRPQNIPKMLPPEWAGANGAWNCWSNVWLGTTVCNQAEFLRNVPLLSSVPAVVRFLSVEPLLEPVYLGTHPALLRGIDWMIVGGESGPLARPMPAQTVEYLRDTCAEQKIPFFFKQWGEFDESGHRVGKKKAGSMFDGVEYKEFPKVSGS